MANDMQVKAAKGKLYNLKSGIEGLITLLDTGTLEPEKAMEGVTTLAAKAFDDYQNQQGSS